MPRGPTCHTCRRKRLLCDGRKPTCQRCCIRGVDCLGFGSKPILWLQPIQKEEKAAVASGTAGEGRRGRPKLVFMSSSGRATKPIEVYDRWYQRHGQLSAPTDDTGRAVLGLEPVDYKAQRLALGAIAYLNNEMLSGLVCTDGKRLELPLEYWCYYPDLLLDTIIATSLTHQLIRCHAGQGLLEYSEGCRAVGYKLGEVQHPHLPVIYEHKQAALAGLRMELQDQNTRYADLVLNFIISLARSEIQQCAYGAWTAHFEAARAIITKRGGFAALADESTDLLDFPLRTYMLIDVVSATTATVADARHAEYLPYVQLMFKHGASLAFPCGNTLFDAIIRINCARATVSHTRNEKRQRKRIAKGLVDQITGFEAASWAEEIVEKASLGYDSEAVADWTELGTAYQLAVLLYCLRRLLSEGKARVGGKCIPVQSVAVLQAAALEKLLAVLKGLQGRSTDRLTLWPLVMAGLGMRDAERRDKVFVCAALSTLSGKVGAMSPLDAAVMLQTYWRDGMGARRGVFC